MKRRDFLKFIGVGAIVMMTLGINLNSNRKQSTIDSRRDSMQTLEDFYHEMWQCLISKNIPRLDEMHSDEFTLTHMTGMIQSKSEYLRAIQNGDLNYFSEETDEIIADATNGKLIGKSRVNAAVFGGGRHTWRLQLDFNVENQNGNWILKSAVASTY